MTDEQLSEIAARCAAATPGPWAYDGAHDEITTPYSETGYWLICSECRTAPNEAPIDNFGHQFSPDFDFIAHARDDVPALLAEIARLRPTRTSHGSGSGWCPCPPDTETDE